MEELQVRFLFWPDGPHFFLIPVADNADRQPLRFSLVLKVFPVRFKGSYSESILSNTSAQLSL
jgi:hypothetical protein